MLGFRTLDRVLRGDQRLDIADGTSFPVMPLVRANLILGVCYGTCMGVFGLIAREEWDLRPMLSGALKIPLLFTLTLLVTFPSLYVFNTLLGSRLTLSDLARLLTAALGVLMAVLAAFGPIVAFFSVTTSSYPFVVLMNVVVMALSSSIGLSFLFRMLASFRRAAQPTEAEEVEDAPKPGSRYLREQNPKNDSPMVFYVWTVVFALVGAQMSWVLRPFIGVPDQPFAWFRLREGSFFQAVVRSIRLLMES